MVTKKSRPASNPLDQPERLKIILEREVDHPIFISVSTAADLGGLGQKTIRRALEQGLIKFKIVNNRYSINLGSLIKYLNSRTKLKNKFKQNGLGQYVKLWK